MFTRIPTILMLDEQFQILEVLPIDIACLAGQCQIGRETIFGVFNIGSLVSGAIGHLDGTHHGRSQK